MTGINFNSRVIAVLILSSATFGEARPDPMQAPSFGNPTSAQIILKMIRLKTLMEQGKPRVLITEVCSIQDLAPLQEKLGTEILPLKSWDCEVKNENPEVPSTNLKMKLGLFIAKRISPFSGQETKTLEIYHSLSSSLKNTTQDAQGSTWSEGDRSGLHAISASLTLPLTFANQPNLVSDRILMSIDILRN